MPLDFLLEDDVEFAAHTFDPTIIGEPATPTEAFARPDGDKWHEAFDAEIQSLNDNATWTLLPRKDIPRSARVLKCRVVFKIKRNADGTVERYKARVVAKGFLQRAGIDYAEVFSPVVHYETIRMLLALSAAEDLEAHHMDFQTALP